MRKRARGTTTVEFAVVGTVFFIVLFAVIEMGRLLFVWNALDEATRRGARVAAICPINHSAIRRVAAFDSPGGTAITVAPGLTAANFSVQYLSGTGTVLADPIAQALQIRYVRVSVTGFQLQTLIPVLEPLVPAPTFATTLPRESLGVSSSGATAECFGTSS